MQRKIEKKLLGRKITDDEKREVLGLLCESSYENSFVFITIIFKKSAIRKKPERNCNETIADIVSPTYPMTEAYTKAWRAKRKKIESNEATVSYRIQRV